MPGRVLKTALILAACSGVTAFAVARAHVVVEWAASIVGREGRKVTGRATAKPTADGKGTDIAVMLAGDTPGATRPWHVHVGSCATGGPVYGGGRAYAPMAVDSNGESSAKATIAVPLSDTVGYYVNVHDAAAAMSIIVACGDLRKQ